MKEIYLMNTFDFDEYLANKLKDSEFKEQFEKASKRLNYIFNNVKGAKKQYLIEEITSINENIRVDYLNTLAIKKLYRLMRYLKRS